MASRALVDLLPDVTKQVIRWNELARLRGTEPLIYCTYRSPEEQDDLYRIGRDIPGKKCTNAKAWQSWHQMRRAWDAVPIVGGKPIWRYSPINPDWQALIAAADELGIEWAGRWTRFKEQCHWQITDGLTLAEARTAIGG